MRAGCSLSKSNAGGPSLGSELPCEHELGFEPGGLFRIRYRALGQVSVTRRVDECDPGRGGKSEERGIPVSAVGGLPRTEGEDDTPAVGRSRLRGKIASFGPFRLHTNERLLEKN